MKVIDLDAVIPFPNDVVEMFTRIVRVARPVAVQKSEHNFFGNFWQIRRRVVFFHGATSVLSRGPETPTSARV